MKQGRREVDIFCKECDKGEILCLSLKENRKNNVYTLLENAVNSDSCNRVLVSEFLNKSIMVTGQKGRRERDALFDEEIIKHVVVNVDSEVHKTELLEFKIQVEM